MTERDEQDSQDRWRALGIRSDIPHPARVYDYLLGGKDNFAADREAAEMSLKISPEMLDSARANRKFMVRAVESLRDSGIRQFLDVGAGLPTSPNTYEVAQHGNSGARVVYVDNDPIVFLHAEGGRGSRRGEHASRYHPAGRPAVRGLPAQHPRRRRPGRRGCPVPEGSGAGKLPGHLPRHGRGRPRPDARNLRRVREAGTVFVGRSKAAIQRMFNSWDLLDPGVVLASYWRPEAGRPDNNADRVWAYAGVALNRGARAA